MIRNAPFFKNNGLPKDLTKYDDAVLPLLPANKLLVNQDNEFRVVELSEITSLSMPVLPPPYLEELIPDSYMPSTTGNFIIRGSFFTPTTTVVIEDQTLNYLTFVSDNEMLANVTTCATEGLYGITINNGTSVDFNHVLLIVLGEVFQPAEADWINTSVIDVTDTGSAKLVTYASVGNAEWIKEFDYTRDWILRFNLADSPLGPYPTGIYLQTDLMLKTIDNVTTLFRYQTYRHPVGLYHHTYTVANDWGYAGGNYGSNLSDSLINNFELRYISGVMYAYVGGVLRRTFTDVLSQNLKLIVRPTYYDFINIKYIEII